MRRACACAVLAVLAAGQGERSLAARLERLDSEVAVLLADISEMMGEIATRLEQPSVPPADSRQLTASGSAQGALLFDGSALEFNRPLFINGTVTASSCSCDVGGVVTPAPTPGPLTVSLTTCTQDSSDTSDGVKVSVGGNEVGRETSIALGETVTFSIPYGSTQFELEALGGDGVYFCRLLVGDNGVSTSDGGTAVTYLMMDNPCDSGANYHDATCYDTVTLYVLSSPPPLTLQLITCSDGESEDGVNVYGSDGALIMNGEVHSFAADSVKTRELERGTTVFSLVAQGTDGWISCGIAVNGVLVSGAGQLGGKTPTICMDDPADCGSSMSGVTFSTLYLYVDPTVDGVEEDEPLAEFPLAFDGDLASADSAFSCTNTGGATWSSAERAYYFDGVDDYILCDASSYASITGSAAKTGCTWSKNEKDDGTSSNIWYIGEQGVGQAFYVRASEDVNGADTIRFNTYSYNIDTGVTMSLGVWLHICARYDGGTDGDVFVDGAKIYDGTFTSMLNTGSANDLCIGCYWGSTAVSTNVLFQGYIADLRLFAGALSDAEISGLYSSLTVRSPAPTPGPTLTLAYTATITTYASDLCVDTTAGGTVTYTGVGCGGGSILWTDAATSAADIRSGEGLSTSTCAWDWTTYSASAQALYGGTCGVNPTIDGGDQLPMSLAACAASATCAYTGGNAPTASPTDSSCYCAVCGTSSDAGYGSGSCGVASGSCSASVSGTGCYSSKPNQGCNCATNTVL